MTDLLPVLQALPPEVIASATAKGALAGFRGWAGASRRPTCSGVPPTTSCGTRFRRSRAGPRTIRRAVSTDPTDILVPEWLVLTDEEKYTKHSGSADFRAVRRKVPGSLRPLVPEVVAVEKLKKVNAFLGFTRIDALDRIDDSKSRVAPLTRDGRPTWVPATEDRGEGFFLQFDETTVLAWEEQVLELAVWETYRRAHELNFKRRTSKTADSTIDPDDRFPAPRYWAIHTLSHLLIREAAMSSGYGSASLTERIYAWREDGERPAAAGLLITTTASDSEGTLGGLVDLSRPERLARSSTRRSAEAGGAPVTRSARTAGHEARRTSSMALPVTSAFSSARPAASGPTASSTDACCST